MGRFPTTRLNKIEGDEQDKMIDDLAQAMLDLTQRLLKHNPDKQRACAVAINAACRGVVTYAHSMYCREDDRAHHEGNLKSRAQSESFVMEAVRLACHRVAEYDKENLH